MLFPGGFLTLRIFEPRYQEMVSECLSQDVGFGVCLLHEGNEETDPEGTFHEVGTYTRIVDWDVLEDGLLGLHCVGERRFNLLRRECRSNGLHVGKIEPREETPCIRAPVIMQPCLEFLFRHAGGKEGLLPGMGDRQQFRNPHWVSYRLAEILPLTAETRQKMLETDEAQPRLKALLAVIHAQR